MNIKRAGAVGYRVNWLGWAPVAVAIAIGMALLGG